MSTRIDRKNPFIATVKERYPLTRSGSTKETFHVVLDLKNSGMAFKVGDAIGIYAENDPILVDRVLKSLNLSGETLIIDPRSQKEVSLRQFFLQKANLGRLTTPLLSLLGCFDETYASSHDLLDALTDFPSHRPPIQELAAHISPLLPRFYSAASAPGAHPDEVHLTVSLSTYLHRGEIRYGVASHFLCHLAKTVPTYIQSTPHFTLPSDENAPIIMVGPGTGVAPFRGFLQERLLRTSPGKNWLFFGERSRATDFYYEEFWNDLAESRRLKLDLAFSRDQAEKIYVQHRLLENGKEIWSWLQSGAYFYVCGEADPMAKQVEAAVRQISEQHGNLSSEESLAFIRMLRQTKRYLADVY